MSKDHEDEDCNGNGNGNSTGGLSPLMNDDLFLKRLALLDNIPSQADPILAHIWAGAAALLSGWGLMQLFGGGGGGGGDGDTDEKDEHNDKDCHRKSKSESLKAQRSRSILHHDDDNDDDDDDDDDDVPITWSIRTALNRIGIEDLEGLSLSQNETLLHIFDTLSKYKTLPPTTMKNHTSTITNRLQQLYRTAVLEANSLCFLNIQRERRNITPSNFVVRKAKKHAGASLAAVLLMVEEWNKYDAFVQGPIDYKTVHKDDENKQNNDDDDDEEDDDDDEDGNEPDPDLFLSAAQAQDPRRKKLFDEWAGVVPAGRSRFAFKEELYRRTKLRTRSQIIKCEADKLGIQLGAHFDLIYNWLVLKKNLSQIFSQSVACAY